MDLKIGIIGMGYVGLPLAIALAKKYKVVGYDNDEKRINSLRKGIDIKNEISQSEINSVAIGYSHKTESLKKCNFSTGVFKAILNARDRSMEIGTELNSEIKQNTQK